MGLVGLMEWVGLKFDGFGGFGGFGGLEVWR